MKKGKRRHNLSEKTGYRPNWTDTQKESKLREISLSQRPFHKADFNTRMESLKTPVILVTKEAATDMGILVTLSDVEIGWFGLVDKRLGPNGNDVYIISKILLMKQQVHATTTEISAGGIAEFMTELIEEDPQLAQEVNAKLRFWGHSHVTMPVEPSGQDLQQMKEFDHCEYFIMGICNRLGMMRFSLYLYGINIAIHDVPWYIADPAAHFEDRVAELKGEMAEKVQEFRYPIITPATHTSVASDDTDHVGVGFVEGTSHARGVPLTASSVTSIYLNDAPAHRDTPDDDEWSNRRTHRRDR